MAAAPSLLPSLSGVGAILLPGLLCFVSLCLHMFYMRADVVTEL